MPAAGTSLLLRLVLTTLSAALLLGAPTGCDEPLPPAATEPESIDGAAALPTAGDGTEAPSEWSWPEGPLERARVEVRGFGTIEIALFAELAPRTVENFKKLASSEFYDGTTFHRVIPGFMIQGGDPLSRNRDPSDDGSGGPGYRIRDEVSRAPHLRGAVSMANRLSPNSGGSQFFIVHQDSQHLDRHYALFGRVVAGLDVLDQIAATERDAGGRWGPRDRPIESVVIEQITILPPRAAGAPQPAPTSALADATGP